MVLSRAELAAPCYFAIFARGGRKHMFGHSSISLLLAERQQAAVLLLLAAYTYIMLIAIFRHLVLDVLAPTWLHEPPNDKCKAYNYLRNCNRCIRGVRDICKIYVITAVVNVLLKSLPL